MMCAMREIEKMRASHDMRHAQWLQQIMTNAPTEETLGCTWSKYEPSTFQLLRHPTSKDEILKSIIDGDNDI